MSDIIQVRDLHKSYHVHRRSSGFKGILKNIINPDIQIKEAVKNINFSIKKGELVGLIGPNGAGKSTTIKILTGILVPDNGEVVVNGLVPYKNRKENAKRIGVVFGHKTQLWWNLPVNESYELIKAIYKIPDKVFKNNMNMFAEILEIDQYLNIPVRQLSLGQRMRAEIAASLLHSPDIVYLDEPTIGLDIVAKDKIRNFITEINREKKVTIILTTHDMGDVEKLCERFIIIDKGSIVYDGKLEKIKAMYGKERILEVVFKEQVSDFKIDFAEIIKSEGTRKFIKFAKDHITAVELVNKLATNYDIKDFSLHETSIESIIKNFYTKEWIS